ncbi:hypothetical protein ACFL96_19555, partial [Thermoproteota archaeon]
FQFSVSGTGPVLGGALMFGSLFFSPLVIGGLSVMTLYAACNVFKYLYDARRVYKSRSVPKPQDKPSSFFKYGKKVYKKRKRAKKFFFLKTITSWTIYGVGAGVLDAAAIAGIAAGVEFPPALLITAGCLMGFGVLSVVYIGTRDAGKYSPKNLTMADVKDLGAVTSIVERLGCVSKRKRALDHYVKSTKKRIPIYKRGLLVLLKALRIFFSILTLGILGFALNRITKMTRFLTIKWMGNPDQDRIRYFINDTSIRKDFCKMCDVQGKSNTEQINDSKRLEYLLFLLTNIKDKQDEAKAFWFYLQESGYLNQALAVYYKRLGKKKMNASPYIRREITEVKFDINRLIMDLKLKKPGAYKTYHALCRITDDLLIYTSHEKQMYEKQALCDHAEDRLRHKQKKPLRIWRFFQCF